MARQRYISTAIWDDEWIQTLSLTEKALFFYFLTNPLTNIAGVYKITDRRIAFDTGLSENEVKIIVEKFEKNKKVVRFNEFIILRNAPKHQKWQTHKNIEKGIIAILENLPPEIFKLLKKIGYAYPMDSLLDPIESLPNPSEAIESLPNPSEAIESLPNPSRYIDLDLNSKFNIDVDTDSQDEKQKKNNINNQQPTNFSNTKKIAESLNFSLSHEQIKAFHCLDPTWLSAKYNFLIFAAEKIRSEYSKKSHNEQERIFAKSWSYQNMKDEYPAWLREKLKAAEREALENLRNKQPQNCLNCNTTMKDSNKCPSCNGFLNFNNQTITWEYIEPVDVGSFDEGLKEFLERRKIEATSTDTHDVDSF
jgi:hypothetical protein